MSDNNCSTCKGLGVINPYYSRHLHPTAIFGTPCPEKCDPTIVRMFADRKNTRQAALPGYCSTEQQT